MSTDETMPAGFERRDGADEFWISYRARGVGCIIVFLVVLLGWCGTIFGYLLLVGGARRFIAFVFTKWWSPLAFAAGAVAYVCFTFYLLWLLFGRTEFIVSRDTLRVRKKLFGVQRTWQIPSETIERFEQVKDGGEGEDSFPSWGLNVCARPPISLLARQPIEKSDWLGSTLSKFYNVEFRACEQRE